MGLFSKLFNKKGKQNIVIPKPIEKEQVKPVEPKPQPEQPKKEGNVFAYKVEVDSVAVTRLKERYIAFDVETTGLTPSKDRIVEIGAGLFENGILAKEFNTLVNPKIPIPPEASRVNNITDDMLSNAPSEEKVYAELVDFLGDALTTGTALCAHNADFDIKFLSAALKRFGYDGDIRYVDTLALARKLVQDVPNHKQETLSDYFGITNDNFHRAFPDAKACGELLWELLKIEDKKDEEEREKTAKAIAAIKPTDEELEVCAVVRNAIKDSGSDISWLRFKKNKSGEIQATCVYSFFTFKFLKSGHYAVVPSNLALKSDLIVEPCSLHEGHVSSKRVFFTNPKQLDTFAPFIRLQYEEAFKDLCAWAFGNERETERAKEYNKIAYEMDDNEMESLLSTIDKKDYSFVPLPTLKPTILLDDVVISTVPNRMPLSEITVKDYKWGEGVLETLEKAEEYRKAGDSEKALSLYEECRKNGLITPYVYEGFSQTYCALKDYENEILILTEGIKYFGESRASALISRRDTAIKRLYKKQETARIAEAKRKEKENKAKRKEEKAKLAETNKEKTKKSVIQMDDAGNIIAEFDSVSAAAKTVGVSTKSIRSAAQGLQNHAAGFVWKYKDTEK